MHSMINDLFFLSCRHFQVNKTLSFNNTMFLYLTQIVNLSKGGWVAKIIKDNLTINSWTGLVVSIRCFPFLFVHFCTVEYVPTY